MENDINLIISSTTIDEIQSTRLNDGDLVLGACTSPDLCPKDTFCCEPNDICVGDTTEDYYWWAGIRVQFKGYKTLSSNTYSIQNNLEDYGKFGISNSFFNNTGSVITSTSQIQVGNQGMPSGSTTAATYVYWASGRCANQFVGSSPTALTVQTPTYFIRSGFTVQTANRQMGTTTGLTDNAIWYVYCGALETNAKRDWHLLSGTSSAIKQASREVLLKEPTYKVYVSGTTNTHGPKAYFNVQYGNFGVWRTGKLGYTLLITSAFPNSSVFVTASRVGSNTTDATCNGNEELRLSTVSSSDKLMTVSDMIAFDVDNADLAYDENMVVKSGTMTGFTLSPAGTNNQCVNRHSFSYFTNTPDYYKDDSLTASTHETLEFNALGTSYSGQYTATWGGSSGNWTGSNITILGSGNITVASSHYNKIVMIPRNNNTQITFVKTASEYQENLDILAYVTKTSPYGNITAEIITIIELGSLTGSDSLYVEPQTISLSESTVGTIYVTIVQVYSSYYGGTSNPNSTQFVASINPVPCKYEYDIYS